MVRSLAGPMGLIGVFIGLIVVPALGFFMLLIATQPDDPPEAEAVRNTVHCGGGQAAQQPPDDWVPYIEEAAKTADIPYSVMAGLIFVESGFQVKAVSDQDAKGPAQFIDSTWAAYGNGGDVFNPADAIPAAGRYLKDLRKMVKPYAKDTEEEIFFAISSYNSGPGWVINTGKILQVEETLSYYPKIMRYAQADFSEDCNDPFKEDDLTDLGDGKWVHPLKGSRITSGYGPRPCPLASCAGRPYLLNHDGVDFAGGPSEYFVAPTDMRITRASHSPTDPLAIYYGPYIYAVQLEEPHLMFEFHEAQWGSLQVKTGDIVKAGEPLGKPGATGNSSGVHLHFQINKPGTENTKPTVHNIESGETMDPVKILREQGVL